MKVIFGGSWSSTSRYARVANPSGDSPDLRLSQLGLRLARSPMQQAQKGVRDE